MIKLKKPTNIQVFMENEELDKIFSEQAGNVRVKAVRGAKMNELPSEIQANYRARLKDLYGISPVKADKLIELVWHYAREKHDPDRSPTPLNFFYFLMNTLIERPWVSKGVPLHLRHSFNSYLNDP